jgi:uncharacterized lipoprotein
MYRNKLKNTIMKKVIAILSIVALASCGGGESTETPTTDSTKVDTTKTVVDTTKTIDTTVVTVDTTKVTEKK